MNIGLLFTTVLVRPIVTVLIAIYQALTFLHIPFALGFSIIILTILIRLLLYPLTRSQLKASKKMQDVAPHIAKLKAKHKGDSKRIQAETMKLYKEHGINPAAGCLPTLLQLPIIWGLYSVLQQVVRSGGVKNLTEVNKLLYIPSLHLARPWDQYFFGLPLGKGPSQLLGAVGPLILLIPVLTAVFQLLQSKMMLPSPVKEYPTDSPKEKKEKEGAEDAMAQVQSQMVYLMPLMIGFFSFQFPLGISLYWNTFTIFGMIQQHRVSGFGGLLPWIKRIRKGNT